MIFDVRPAWLAPLATLFVAFASCQCNAATAADVAAPNFFPALGATDVPPGAPLPLTSATAPQPGSKGTIRIIETKTNVVVETIDVARSLATKDIGGLSHFNYHPVFISDRTAASNLRNAPAYDKGRPRASAPRLTILACGASAFERPHQWLGPSVNLTALP